MDTQLAQINTAGNAKPLKLKRPKHLNDQTEADVVRQLDRMLAAAKADKFKVAGNDHENWETLFDFYLGGANHWKGYPGKLTGYQQFTDNRVGRDVVLVEELLDEMHIAADIQPREPGDEATAAVLSERFQYVWDKEHNREAVSRASLWARICGCGFFRISWDPELEDGLGDWRLHHIDSRDLFCEPLSPDIDSARWWAYVRRMDAAEAQTRYGIPEDEMPTAEPKDETFGEFADADTRGPSDRAYEVAAPGEAQPTSRTWLLPAHGFFGSEDQKEVEVQEWWTRGDKKHWPNGRHTVRVGPHIVIDEEYKYECGKWPLAVVWDQRDPKRVWGDCAARQSIEMQRELNISRSLEILSFHLNINIPLVNFPQTGIPTEALQANAALAGMVFDGRNPGVLPEPLVKPQMWSQSLNHIDAITESIDKNMRIQDVIPPGARGYPASGEVIRELRESQLVSIRAKATLKGKAIRRAAEIALSLMQQFYVTDRFIRISGPVPKQFLGLVYNPEGEELTEEVLAEGTHWLVLNPDNIKHGFDVVVTPTSWEPLSKQTQVEKVFELAKEDGWKTILPSDVLELEAAGPLMQRLLRKVRQREQAPPPQPAMPPEQAMMGQPQMPMGMPVPGQPMMGGGF